MPSTAFTTAITASALVAGAVLSAAVPVLAAAIGGAHTPGARASAVVEASGTVVRSTGVTSVRKIAAGQYCIELDPNINAAKTVPVVTANAPAPAWGSNAFIYVDSAACGDTARNILVVTGRPAAASGYEDTPFNVVVD